MPGCLDYRMILIGEKGAFRSRSSSAAASLPPSQAGSVALRRLTSARAAETAITANVSTALAMIKLVRAALPVNLEVCSEAAELVLQLFTAPVSVFGTMRVFRQPGTQLDSRNSDPV